MAVIVCRQTPELNNVSAFCDCNTFTCILQHALPAIYTDRQVLLKPWLSLLQELHILTAPAAADIVVPSANCMYVFVSAGVQVMW